MNLKGRWAFPLFSETEKSVTAGKGILDGVKYCVGKLGRLTPPPTHLELKRNFP